MPHGTNVPITPEVLRWAIGNSGLTVPEVAEELGVSRAVLDAWTRGDEEPLLTQLKALAELLKGPTAFFFLPEPPQGGLPEAGFRHPPGGERTRSSALELRYLRETARLQRTLSWLRKELGETAASIPRVATTEDVDHIALQARKLLEVTVSDQRQWANSSQALREWRDAFGRAGIYVFLFPLGKDSCRGFSLWDSRAPALSVNTHWKAEVRIYTMFHELGHLLTRSSSICVSPASHLRISGGDVIERWCERFSAATLLPWDALLQTMREQLGWRDSYRITDLDDLRTIARSFGVSLRAAALRLIEGGYAGWSLYDEIPEWSRDKGRGGGHGRTRRQMREDLYGEKRVRTFVSGLDNDLITRADAITYLNVSDIDLYGMQEQRRWCSEAAGMHG